MLDEIRTGVEHICSLLGATPSSKVLNGFSAMLCQRLELRYANNWFPQDGERGSASRALTWHAHGGGEGLDRDILAACRVLLDTRDSGTAFQPSKAAAAAAASGLFTTPFTLWIDPGCVAVRHGFGPGTYVEGAPAQPQNFDVLLGKAPTAKTPIPVAVAAPAGMPPPPTLALLPSTPALGSGDSAVHASPAPTGSAGVQHYRAPSWASSTTSQYRSGSPTSRSSSLTTASSSACPSLVAASSTHCDSDSEYCEDDGEDGGSQLSIQDMMDRGGFTNFDIIDDDEEDVAADDLLEQALQRRMKCLEADATIGETTVGLFGLPGDQTVQAVDNDDKPTFTAITSYDGGNVGVLGGGVRLGASRAVAQPASKPKQAWHPSQAWEGANKGTPITALPLPASQTWSNINASPALSVSALSSGAHFPHSLPSPIAASPCLSSVCGDMHEQQYVMIDGYAVPIAKRGRTRGRRSRGRGAGRAARRQAAAVAAAAAQDGVEMDQSWSDDGDLTAPTLVMPSALGISMDSGLSVKSHQGVDADARLMAIIRQSADRVTQDVVRRHLMEQQQQQQQQQQRGKSLDRSRNSTPRVPAYATASPAMRGQAQATFAAMPPMPVGAVAHQQYFQQRQAQQPHYSVARPACLPAHMQQPVSFSPRINAMHGGLY